MKHVSYIPQGVCSVNIDYNLDDKKKLHNEVLRYLNEDVKAI